MKTNICKILILFVVLAIFVGIILLFAWTKVKPPMDIEKKEVYNEYLEQCADRISRYSIYELKDSAFNSAVVHIITFRKEKKVKDQYADTLLKNIVNEYAPQYADRCFDKFNQSVWYDKELEHILSRISMLNGLKYSNNNTVVSSPNYKRLDQIATIINKYRSARNLCKSATFVNVEKAYLTIKEAEEYAEDKYLSNCTSLRTSLLDVRSKIAKSHLNYLHSETNKLSLYRRYSEEDYNYLKKRVPLLIDEYNDNAKSIYDLDEDIIQQQVKELYNKAKTYWREADNYYSVMN